MHWFRKGLRLHDNPALLRALEDKSEHSQSATAVLTASPLSDTAQRTCTLFLCLIRTLPSRPTSASSATTFSSRYRRRCAPDGGLSLLAGRHWGQNDVSGQLLSNDSERHHFVSPQALRDLDGSLRKLGSRLYVLKGKPEEQLPSAWAVRFLVGERPIGDSTPVPPPPRGGKSSC